MIFLSRLSTTQGLVNANHSGIGDYGAAAVSVSPFHGHF